MAEAKAKDIIKQSKWTTNVSNEPCINATDVIMQITGKNKKEARQYLNNLKSGTNESVKHTLSFGHVFPSESIEDYVLDRVGVMVILSNLKGEDCFELIKYIVTEFDNKKANPSQNEEQDNLALMQSDADKFFRGNIETMALVYSDKTVAVMHTMHSNEIRFVHEKNAVEIEAKKRMREAEDEIHQKEIEAKKKTREAADEILLMEIEALKTRREAEVNDLRLKNDTEIEEIRKRKIAEVQLEYELKELAATAQLDFERKMHFKRMEMAALSVPQVSPVPTAPPAPTEPLVATAIPMESDASKPTQIFYGPQKPPKIYRVPDGYVRPLSGPGSRGGLSRLPTGRSRGRPKRV
jgi:hypothetical protein